MKGFGLGLKSMFKETVTIDGIKYTVKNTIGEGGFAFVYRVKSDNGKNFALKKMICQTEEQEKEADVEIKVLQNIKNSNVLSLIGYSIVNKSSERSEYNLLLPLYSGTIESYIEKANAAAALESGNGSNSANVSASTSYGYPNSPFNNTPITSTNVIKIISGIINGIIALHQAGYRHNDLKPANVLLNNNYDAILTDLGSASELIIDINSRSQALDIADWHNTHTTSSIKAPELFDPPSSGLVINGKSDVWSLGCTIYAMLFCRTPFENPIEGFSSLAALSGSYTIPSGHPWSKDMIDFISSMLQSNLSNRLTIEEVKVMFEKLPLPPADLTHVHPVEEPKAPMPLWDGDITSTSTSNKGGKASSGKLHTSVHAPAPATVVEVDWGDGDGDFSANFENNTIITANTATVATMTAATVAATTATTATNVSNEIIADFEATNGFDIGEAAAFEANFQSAHIPATVAKIEVEDGDGDGNDDFDADFGDFESATKVQERHRSLSMSTATATEAETAETAEVTAPAASTVVIPTELSCDESENSDSEDNVRESEDDEFGDNNLFQSHNIAPPPPPAPALTPTTTIGKEP